MAARTSMLHVRVDERLKAEATETLANVGLTVSDAVRILLTRVTKEGGMPAGLVGSSTRIGSYTALADARPAVPHQQVMDEAQALIDRKRRARS